MSDMINTTFKEQDGLLYVHRTQDAEPVVDYVTWMRENARKDHGEARWRYLGSLPLVVAEVWAAECGAAIGTAEFTAYARKKLMDGEFAKLRGFNW